MEHLRTAVATLVGLGVMLALMAALTISPAANNSPCHVETPQCVAQCDVPQQPSPGPSADKVPTLAPPRLIPLSNADSTLPSGQPVYVQVKADRNDVEIGWASTDFMGR
jgi:hypothetical protein